MAEVIDFSAYFKVSGVGGNRLWLVPHTQSSQGRKGDEIECGVWQSDMLISNYGRRFCDVRVFDGLHSEREPCL